MNNKDIDVPRVESSSHVLHNQDRLKTLAVWFQQWLEAGEDWANTQLVIEATRVNQENYAAKEVMKSFKTLCDQYGKKVAEGIRQRKYAKEKSRDPRVDPKPYHMDHPDGIEDPEPWTLFNPTALNIARPCG